MKKAVVSGIDLSRKYICMECGCQRDPIEAKRGLLAIEICMWLLYILPGVIYSIWRRVRKQQICSNCRNPSIELTSSSRVMKMMRLMKTFPQPLMANSKNPKPTSSPKLIQSQKPKPEKKDLSQILKSANRRGLKPKGQQGLIDFKPPNQDK